jgi:Ca2+-transporting ATPase
MVMQMLGVGLGMFVLLFGLWQLLWHTDISTVSDLFSMENATTFIRNFFDYTHDKQHMNGTELGVFFSTFVLLQFWNIFNVKYFRTDRSLLLDIIDWFRDRKKVSSTYSKGFVLISLVILLGQILIVQFAGPLFNVSPLSIPDWSLMILTTSLVLIIPEIFRGIKILTNK